MKSLLTVILFLTGTAISNAQSDSIKKDFSEYPNGKCMQSIYSPETKTYNTSFNYSNLWDLDGDGKKDSLFFIGNGGASTHFFLRVALSTDHKVRDFENIQIPAPYFTGKEIIHKEDTFFEVYDLDKDGVSDIYLNLELDNTWSHIPRKWKRDGVRTKYIIMSFKGGKLKVKDY